MGLGHAQPRGGRVLIVEDDAPLRLAVAKGLRGKGHRVLEASGCAEARAVVASERLDVVLLDLQLADGEAFDLLPVILKTDPSITVFIISGHGTIDTAVRALKQGAEDFLTKPLSQPRLHALVEGAMARRSANASGARRKVTLSSWSSPAMLELERQVERLHSSDVSILILGETGTGKSVLARRLHAIGARSRGRFVDVNCAGLTRDFVESELFGHERGAFTGAHSTKVGLFEMADGGTLFLDEIGDIDLAVQPKVLKVLEEQKFRRMGDVRERSANVRLIAATHRDLLQAATEKTFRADLYYRISTVTLTLPPLRRRREDILTLAGDVLASEGDDGVALSQDGAQKLLAYSWPGNLRELKNVLVRALLLRRGAVIEADDIHFDAPHRSGSSAPPPDADHGASGAHRRSSSHLLTPPAMSATRQEIEREHIRLALEAEGGRVEAAARRLGIPRSTLYWKLKAYGLTSGPRSARGRGPADGSS